MGGDPHGDEAVSPIRTSTTGPEGLGRDRIEDALRAGARALALLTGEEDRALERLEAVAERLGWPVRTWSPATGVDGDGRPTAIDRLLDELSGDRGDALWVLLDATAEIGTGAARRRVRELAQRTSGPAIAIVQPHDAPDPRAVLSIPELVIEVLAPPSLVQLSAHVAWIGRVLEDNGHPGAAARLSEGGTAIASAALGLPLRDVDRLVAEAVLAHGTDPGAIAAHVRREKPGRIDRGGLLESVEPAPLEELGGLHALKRWLATRALALRPHAAAAGIPAPRGVLLLGVQGCGKSLAARVCAGALGLPLLRLDPGRIFGGTVGESEANLRRITALLERLAPAVLWLDEIDKGLAGIEGTASDAGTTARVIGALLTWMQERTAPIFVAATANRVDVLPPELLRRGRLDEIFFVDLPDADARAEILHVCFAVRPERAGITPHAADPWPAFASAARAADGFSGAELEAALVDARLGAFAEDRPVAAADLKAALDRQIPLSRTRAETIEALRAWARGRARSA
jgi:MoxR-like ATPase